MDYKRVKRCCKGKTICFKIIFFRNETTKDGYKPECISCCKKLYHDNRDRISNNLRTYFLKPKTKKKTLS